MGIDRRIHALYDCLADCIRGRSSPYDPKATCEALAVLTTELEILDAVVHTIECRVQDRIAQTKAKLEHEKQLIGVTTQAILLVD